MLDKRASYLKALHTHATTSVSTQEKIDALGGSKSISAWDARFELAYEKCKDENVTLVGGVAPTAVRFARYTLLTRQC
jgi:hypothetical protein